MAQDILDELSSDDTREFMRDFNELIRVYNGIKDEYREGSKSIDKDIKEYDSVVKLFNSKYKGIEIKFTHAKMGFSIFLKEKSAKDAFTNAASRLNGLKDIGANEFGKASVDEETKFTRELGKVKDKIFLSFVGQEGDSFVLEDCKGRVTLDFDEGICSEKSPQCRLCCYYAVKDGIGDEDVYSRLCAMGFGEQPLLQKVRKFLQKFDPKLNE
ncbi:MAG TPA: hypothetical protein VFF28_01275 [Candidatus Nanoarchaeia archaeon]|nr:hypothetical protein [Candidatus Nanoarchaeia archaeon]